jgi:hypothetical protein
MDTVYTIRTLDKYFIPEITNLILDYSSKGLWDYKMPLGDDYNGKTYFRSFDNFVSNIGSGGVNSFCYYPNYDVFDIHVVSDKDSLIMMNGGGLEINVRVLNGEYENVYKYLERYFNFI